MATVRKLNHVLLFVWLTWLLATIGVIELSRHVIIDLRVPQRLHMYVGGGALYWSRDCLLRSAKPLTPGNTQAFPLSLRRVDDGNRISLGLAYFRSIVPSGIELTPGCRLFHVSLWASVLIPAAFTIVVVVRWVRRREACQSCGYPRIGIPTGSPCPECGASSNR